MFQFEPYIYVEHSLRKPTLITVAAFTGAPWRFLHVPASVLSRGLDAQAGWASWCVRRHFRESNGECLLFGSITGYRWQRSRDECVLLDTLGHIVEVKHETFAPPSGRITVGNRTFPVGLRGTWQVNSKLSV
jgi:hypothetical protein